MTDRGGSAPGGIWADGSKDARLRVLHAEGASFRMIGAELGCSRNAAISRANRIGLASRGQSNGAKTGHAIAHINRAKAAAPLVTAKPKHDQTPPAIIAERKQAVDDRQAQFASEAEGTADAFDRAIPKRQRKTIMQLENKHCRFPVGMPGEPGFFYCGGKANNAAGQVYCSVHSARAFNGVPKKPRLEFRGRG